MSQFDGDRFANHCTQVRNQCCISCGVPRKLLCVKNGRFVRNPQECARIRNCGNCNWRCGFKTNCGRGCGDGNNQFFDDSYGYDAVGYANCDRQCGRGCGGRRGFRGGRGGGRGCCN